MHNSDPTLRSHVTVLKLVSTMEHDVKMGLSFWAIVAIVCNSLVGILILILFVILYKACKVPSYQDKMPVFTARLEQKKAEQTYMLTAA